MTIDTLLDRLAPFARDLSANLRMLLNDTSLDEQQKWGAFLAASCAVGQPDVVRAVAASAVLSPEARDAAKGAAAIMGMTNVYYRSIHMMREPDYRAVPTRFRMSIVTHPGVPRTDFDLWCVAVSAINGCGECLDSHEADLRKRDVPVAAIQTAIRIAAVIHAVSRVLAAEAALQD